MSHDKTPDRLRMFAELAPDLFFSYTPEGVITYASRALERLTGRPVDFVVGKNVFDLLPPQLSALVHEKIIALVRGEPEARFELEMELGEGRPLRMDVRCIPIVRGGVVREILGLARDVTDRRLADEQLNQAEKMEAVVRLAGGVAHDFNNLLTIIGGYSDLLLTRVVESDPNRTLLDEIVKASRRAAALTQQLMAFSRRQVIQPRILNLNAIVSGAENSLRRLVGDELEFRLDMAPDIGRIQADAAQIEQVIFNLVANAKDACRPGDAITVRTENTEVRAAGVAGAHRPGRFVVLTVIDTGCGMDDKTKRYLFEPFFSTKEPGKGTGLGLATVYGIAGQNGGHVTVWSEPGEGSRFQVYFPRVHGAEEPLISIAGEGRKWGEETVLLVEDEDGVRKLLAETLRASGYEVLEAGDGGEALRIATLKECRIDLVLTDLVMPGISGSELARQIRVLRPGTKVLYMTGYAGDPSQDPAERDLHVLGKPFSGEALGRRVRAILDQ